METQEIRYFLAMARELNFTRAAQSCGVSQPALTRAIQKLEAELGAALFLRRPGKVELTQLGRNLRPEFEAINTGMTAVKQRASVLANAQANTLRLGVMCTVGPVYVVNLLKALSAEMPDVEVSVVDGAARQIADLVVADEVDAAVVAWPAYPDTISVRPLFCERYAFAMLPGDALLENAAVSLEHLSGRKYLDRLSCEFVSFYEASHGPWSVELDICFASEREDWIQALILAGLGGAIVPEHMPLLPGIETRPLKDPQIVRQISLVTPRSRPLGLATQTLLDIAARTTWPEI